MSNAERMSNALDPGADLLNTCATKRFATILADPPWQFINRTGKVAPEHKRLNRYGTMDLAAICALPVAKVASPVAHLYLWVPNALLPEGLQVMKSWGFQYKSNLIWHKIRKDGGPDGRGVGFYFRNVTEIILFGTRGKNARTLAPGRSQVNFLATRKREHSRKPDEIFPLIEACSPGPRLELFARGSVKGGVPGEIRRMQGMSRPGIPMHITAPPSTARHCCRWSPINLRTRPLTRPGPRHRAGWLSYP